MIKQYCDINHETIINYLSNLEEGCFGLERIKRLFRDVKDSVYYDCFAPLQKASETLVMGRGNNFDKTVLLHSLLLAGGFDSRINLCYVKDRTKRIISRLDRGIQWYYVEVNFMGRKIELDCSFDKGFMRAAGIINKDTSDNYSIDKYFADNISLFEILGKPVQIDEDNITAYDGTLKVMPV